MQIHVEFLIYQLFNIFFFYVVNFNIFLNLIEQICDNEIFRLLL